MTTLRLSAHDRRTLIRGGTIVSVLLLFARVAPDVRAWSSEQHRVARTRWQAVRHAEEAAQRRRWTRRALARVDSLLVPFDSAALAGASSSAAATALSDEISESAAAAGATLGSVQLRRDSLVMGTLTHVSATASLSGDLGALALFLESIEAGPPLLAVRQVSISGAGAALPGAHENLRLEVLVEGVFDNEHAGLPR